MKRRIILVCFFIWSMLQHAEAQDYIQKKYGPPVFIKNLVYGTAINYLGNTDTLKLDLYKPAGNFNTRRPLLILNHGGAWVAGDKTDASILQVAGEFTARGFVVASVSYRLGTHKANWAANPCPPTVNAGYHIAYIADSAEIYRALFRAVQDLKGAIRFLKGRSLIDSICPSAVFIGGESAGGFNALAVAFLDSDNEKPASCGTIQDVPMPQTALLDNYPGGMVNGTQLKRPDLGPVEGNLNLNGHNASVQGVISFYGGLMSESLSKNWISGTEDLSVYMYHQTCDGIVPCQTAVCLSPMSVNCNLGYTPFHTGYPLITGSCGLNKRIPAAIPVKSELFSCDGIVFPLLDCIRFAQNGSYHYTANVPARCDTIARFLSGRVKKQLAACQPASTKEISKNTLTIAPNPAFGPFRIQTDNDRWTLLGISDNLGRQLSYSIDETGSILPDAVSAGWIWIRVLVNDKPVVRRLYYSP